jgi:hypothetical protein
MAWHNHVLFDDIIIVVCYSLIFMETTRSLGSSFALLIDYSVVNGLLDENIVEKYLPSRRGCKLHPDVPQMVR